MQMNFNRVSTKVSSHYICDPYSTLIHYKRTFKLLQSLRQHDVSILCLGSKNQIGIKWQNYFKSVNVPHGRCDESILSSASKYYDAIVCADMLLHAPTLRGISLPVIGIATATEIHEHPEILDVIDYLLPAPTGRKLLAMQQLLKHEYLDKPTVGDAMKGD